MKKNYLLVLISLIFFQSVAGASPVDAVDLDVMRPDTNKEEDVPKHYFAEGVVKNDSNTPLKDKMIVTTVVLPATWPYYYVQGLSKLVNFGRRGEI